MMLRELAHTLSFKVVISVHFCQSPIKKIKQVSNIFIWALLQTYSCYERNAIVMQSTASCKSELFKFVKLDVNNFQISLLWDTLHFKKKQFQVIIKTNIRPTSLKSNL